MQTPTLRKVDLDNLVGVLRSRHARRWDVVLPSPSLSMDDEGRLVIPEWDVKLDMEGVGRYETRRTFDLQSTAVEHLSERLSIPIAYLRRCIGESTPLAASNVNTWLGRDSRSVMVRTLRGDCGEPGVARAVMSDRYKTMDDLDVLMAALQGIRDAGVDAEVTGADLTERRMYVRIDAPQIQAVAPDLVANYRDPNSGRRGQDWPALHTGLVLTNSEVGAGAFNLVPRITFLVCKNGMTRTVDALRQVHIGGRMDEGAIEWSSETEQRNLELVASKTKDAVGYFLSQRYLDNVVGELRQAAAIDLSAPADTVRQVTKALRYDEATQDAILNAFARGGDTSVLGVGQAITAHAQTVGDGDRSFELEADAFQAMELARNLA